MSLLDVQNFLAGIYTDETLRREFSAAPQRIGRANNLTEKEIAELVGMLPAEIDFFADALLFKRLHAVEKLLPLTRKTLGKDFEKLFREFARRSTPESIKRHLEDAVAFADFLQIAEVKLFWARDAAKFERTNLEFNNSAKRFALQIFDCDVEELDSRIAAAPSPIRRRKTLAMWIKFGDRTRRFVW